MQYDVLTIGSATRDVFVESQRFQTIETDIFDEGEAECLPAGAKVEVEQMTFTTGGGATNAAVTFARQGLDAATITRVGEDIRGDEIQRELEDEGVGTDFVQIDPERPTGYSLLLLSPDGERTVLVSRGASQHLDEEAVPWNDVDTEWLHITSLGGDMAFLQEALEQAETHGWKVFLNPGSKELAQREKLLALLEKVDVLNVNLDEAADLVGMEHDKKQEIFHALWDKTRDIVVVTDGPNGSDVYDGKHTHHAGIFPEKRVADRTGAGDAFGAGFVSALVRGENPKEGMRVGSANSTSVIESVGAKTGILTLEDLDDKRWAEFEVTESDPNISV